MILKRLLIASEAGGVLASLAGAMSSQAVMSWGGCLLALAAMAWSRIREERKADELADRQSRRDAREQARYDKLADTVLAAKVEAIAAGKPDPFPGWLDMLEPPSSRLEEHGA